MPSSSGVTTAVSPRGTGLQPLPTAPRISVRISARCSKRPADPAKAGRWDLAKGRKELIWVKNIGPSGRSQTDLLREMGRDPHSSYNHYLFLAVVFLGDSEPVPVTELPRLDFQTIGTNFESLSPQLDQNLFMRYGRNDAGDIQRFYVPTGTTPG
jgi:hypothetical protein